MCSFVWELEVDRSAGEQDEREGGIRGVEAVAASDDEPDLGVEAFDATVLLMPARAR
jgi:hypothetical protein